MRTESSNIRHLTDTNRMGHTCANLNGELFFIWGGQTAPEMSSGQAASAAGPTRNSHLWIYETLTGYWCKRQCAGDCPPYLTGSTSALIGQKMYVFGGHSTVHENWLNCLYCLDLDSLTWTDLGARAKVEPTKPIRADKCSSWAHAGRLYVFGGYGWSQLEHLLQLQDRQKDLQLASDQRWPQFGWNNQLVEFEPSQNLWRWPSYSGRCPSARAAHSGALVDNKYYLFGGRDSCQRLNDLYQLDMDSMHWTQIAVIAEPTLCLQPRPVGRLARDHSQEASTSRPSHLVQTATNELEDADDDDDDDDDEAGEPDEQDFPIAACSSRPACSRTGANTIGDADNNNNNNSSEFECTDTEEDDDNNYDGSLDRPHASSLLERWSLASETSSSLLNGGEQNCSIETRADMADGGQQSQQNQPADEPDGERRQAIAQTSDEQRQQDAPELAVGPQLEADDATMADTVEQQVPVGRSFCSFTPISKSELLLFGGISSQDKTLDDCWLFNVDSRRWSQLDLRSKQARLWHTAARTRNNELVVIGGSCSSKVDEFCSDVLILALEPKSLKRLALDSAARSVKMRSINRISNIPSTIYKLVKLRKQAIALTMRRNNSSARANQLNQAT